MNQITLNKFIKTFEQLKYEEELLIEQYHRARTKKSKKEIMFKIQQIEEELLK